MDARNHKFEDDKNSVINELAKYVEKALSNEKLISNRLGSSIKHEIIDALSKTEYTDAQYDILHELNKEFKKQKHLSETCQNLVGNISVPTIYSVFTGEDIKMSGWCQLYFNSLDKSQLITHKFCDHLRGPKDQRQKKVIASFFTLLATCADQSHLSQLICESTDSNVSTVQILRQTHGLFAAQKDTGRYKRYIKQLHQLDVQTNTVLRQYNGD